MCFSILNKYRNRLSAISTIGHVIRAYDILMYIINTYGYVILVYVNWGIPFDVSHLSVCSASVCRNSVRNIVYIASVYAIVSNSIHISINKPVNIISMTN